MDLLKAIFAPGTEETTTTTEKKTEVSKTTVEEKHLPRQAETQTREGVVIEKEIQCQPEQEIERIREIEIEKVQPVVHIDREQTEVRQVVQPIVEKEVRPTLVTKATKEVELGTRQEKASGVPTPLEGRSLGEAPKVESRTEFLGVEKQRQEFRPIVKETVHKKVVEQVTPVVEKEVVIPHVIEQTKHIHETVQEKPVITHEVREPITADEWAKKEGAVCKTTPQKI